MSFNISFEDKRKNTIKGYLFLCHGLEYDRPEIYIGFKSDLRAIKVRMDDKEFLKMGQFFDKPEIGDDEWYGNWNLLWFKLTKIDILLDSEDAEPQESIIGEFISEVIERVVSF